MTAVADAVQRLTIDPGDAQAHARLADAYLGGQQWMKAAALYRTARTLGSPREELAALHDLCVEKDADAWPPGAFNHNATFRVRWLGERLRERYPSGRFSLLDAGGGEGRLGREVPDADYVLVDPGTNGVFVDSRLDLGRRFDAVVCCHVLEHVPRPDRDAFLDSLCGLATDTVMLLNPVQDDKTDVNAWNGLVFDLTGADWAKEHMECDMPRVEDMVSYCERRGLSYRLRPNGFLPMTLAMVFFDALSGLAPKPAVDRINAMFNELTLEHLDSEQWPNAWFLEIDVAGPDR